MKLPPEMIEESVSPIEYIVILSEHCCITGTRAHHLVPKIRFQRLMEKYPCFEKKSRINLHMAFFKDTY